MIMPRGGKLLSSEDSFRLAVVHSADRDKLIEHIAERLRAQEEIDDRWGRRKKVKNAMSKLDSEGRCCGRKPLFYKGGSFRSPPGSPMFFCCRCSREFDPEGNQRPNWAWLKDASGEFVAGRE